LLLRRTLAARQGFRERADCLASAEPKGATPMNLINSFLNFAQDLMALIVLGGLSIAFLYWAEIFVFLTNKF
jgi:hypothetical protein